MVAGAEVPVVWQGRRVRAFVPELLSERDLALSPGALAATAAASAQVALGAASMPEDHKPLARLLLRAEGVASSYLEGLTAPLPDVVLAEAGGQPGTTAGWVAANSAALGAAVADAHERALDVDLMCAWHALLMAGSPLLGRHVGAVRREQGWIGGTSPLDAALVTPPPDHLPALLADLCDYANRDDVDPIAQAAVVHAQFEVCHPFADGNGRVGRVLVSWLLTRRLALVTPPPVSIRMAAERDGYLSGLTLFRVGNHDTWVRWFAGVVTGAGRRQQDLVREVAQLRVQWRERLAALPGRTLRRDALAWRVLDLLPAHLVLTSGLVAAELGTTARSATAALRELTAAGILAPHVPGGPRPPGRPAVLHVAPELLAVAR